MTRTAKRAAPWLVVGGLALLLLLKGPLLAAWGGFENVEPAEAARLVRDEGALVLDVREPSEWEQVRIPGARLLPLGRLEARLAELDSSRPIVVQCAVGGRSAVAAARLRQAGFARVYNLDGGLEAWRRKGLPTEP